MSDHILRFRVPGALWCLEIPEDAAAVLEDNVQRGWLKREAVGQLYTRDLTSEFIVADMVTRLPAKWSSFRGVGFDVRDAEDERKLLFAQGLHCLGFWHSHPEEVPHPSGTDLQLAADHAHASMDIFTGLLFLIVGRAPFPKGLSVWLHDGNLARRAEPE